MKRCYREYLKYTPKQTKKIWDECIFVFDSSALISFYRYSEDNAKEQFRILKGLKDDKRLWIPDYAIGEFFKNRNKVIIDSKNTYSQLEVKLKKEIVNLEKLFEDESLKRHSFLKIPDLVKKLKVNIKDIIEELGKKNETHPNRLDDDDILKELEEIFDGCIGDSYDDKRISEIKKDGKQRYACNIPLGFCDADKESNKYGDLIIWKQIIDFAKIEKKPIVYISNDTKEDWWLTASSQRIMPHPLLKKEMKLEAGVDFHIYTTENFLKHSVSDIKSKKLLINETKRIRESQENSGTGSIELMRKRRSGNYSKYKLSRTIDEKRYRLISQIDRCHMDLVEYYENRLVSMDPRIADHLSFCIDALNDLSEKIGYYKISKRDQYDIEEAIHFLHSIIRGICSSEYENDLLRREVKRISLSIKIINKQLNQYSD